MFDGPTKSEVRDALKALGQEHGEAKINAEMIRQYRARWPESTCSDATALRLEGLYRQWGRGR